MLQRISRKPTACGKETGREGQVDGGRKRKRGSEHIGLEAGAGGWGWRLGVVISVGEMWIKIKQLRKWRFSEHWEKEMHLNTI